MSGRGLIRRVQEFFGRDKEAANRQELAEAEQAHLDDIAHTDYEARKDDVHVDEYFPDERTSGDDE